MKEYEKLVHDRITEVLTRTGFNNIYISKEKQDNRIRYRVRLKGNLFTSGIFDSIKIHLHKLAGITDVRFRVLMEKSRIYLTIYLQPDKVINKEILNQPDEIEAFNEWRLLKLVKETGLIYEKIASLTGLSIATISRFFNYPDKIKYTTKYKIIAGLIKLQHNV